jgi:nitrate reductase gamma subunit
VVLTGFLSEALHYARMEPHREIVYFVHLVFVATLLMYLPYSKFAHLIYRTTAMVYAEHSGRNAAVALAGPPREDEKKGETDQTAEYSSR